MMRRLEEQRHVSTAAAIEKSGTADTIVGQKSGPALAGPAAPATTALDHSEIREVVLFHTNLRRSVRQRSCTVQLTERNHVTSY